MEMCVPPPKGDAPLKKLRRYVTFLEKSIYPVDLLRTYGSGLGERSYLAQITQKDGLIKTRPVFFAGAILISYV